MGFADYLVKPVRQSSLIERLRARPKPGTVENNQQVLPAAAPAPSATPKEG